MSRPDAVDTAEEIVVDETGRPKAKAAPVAIVATDAKPASVAGSAPTKVGMFSRFISASFCR